VALENLDVLRFNGFEVVVDGRGQNPVHLERMEVDEEESPHTVDPVDGDDDNVQWIASDRPGHEKRNDGRLQLVAHPISKNTVFDLSGAFVACFSLPLC